MKKRGTNECAHCDNQRDSSSSGYCADCRRLYYYAVTVANRIAAGKPAEYVLRRKHGCTYKPWFKNYEGMIRRASGKHPSPCYAGVTVCDEWRNDPRLFGEWAEANGFRPGLTIDRIDPKKGYSPQNCQWLTLSENVSRSYITTPMSARKKRGVAI